MKELYQWIKLFFWLKKRNNEHSTVDYWVKYSNGFTDSVRSATGYDDQIPALWTLINNIIYGIERYHNWHNKERLDEFKPLRLDISKNEVDAYNAKGFGISLEEYQSKFKE